MKAVSNTGSAVAFGVLAVFVLAVSGCATNAATGK